MIIRIPYRPRGHDFIDPQNFLLYASTSKKRTVIKDSLFSPACQSEKVIMIFPLISTHLFCIVSHTNKLEIFSVYSLSLYSYGYGAINLITQTGREYGRESIKHEGSGEYGTTKWTKNLLKNTDYF